MSNDDLSFLDEQTVLNAILRSEFSAFINKAFLTVSPGDRYKPNWHIDAIAHHLQQCRLGQIKRLLITVPPRNLKSICASVALPAFLLGHDPTHKVICVSYSNELASKHARDCRAVIQSEWYKSIFPATRIDPEKNAELEVMTTRRGFRLATSVNATLTGRGADTIIVDDPIKPQDALSEASRKSVLEWYSGTLLSRLDDKSAGCIIVVMQRLHMDDLAGHLLEQNGWTVLNLPAIATEVQRIPIGHGQIIQRAPGDVLHPDHEPMNVLDELKLAMGSFRFSAQYQQTPVPVSGNLVQLAWFQRYAEPPARTTNDIIVQSWDTASKPGDANDYSVCTTWQLRGRGRERQSYLLDVYRARLDYPSLERKVAELKQRHGARIVLVEDTALGTSILQRRATSGLKAIKVENDKVTRLAAQSAQIEAGQVFIPEQASWLAEFQTEMLVFPEGKYDDQVDSVSQYLNWVEQRQRVVVRTYDF